MQAKTSEEFLKRLGSKIPHQEISFRGLIWPYWAKLALGALLLIASNAIVVLLPKLINMGVSLFENNESQSGSFFGIHLEFSQISRIAISIAVLALFGAAIRILSRIVIFGVGRSIEYDARRMLFYQLSIFDEPFYTKHPIGDIMNHLTNDISNIRMVAGFAILNIMNIALIFMLNIPLLFAIDESLAFCALLPFPLIVIAMSVLSKRLFATAKVYQEEIGLMVSHVQENLLGAQLVRLYHRQDAEEKRFAKRNERCFDAAVKQAQVRMLLLPLMRLIIGLALALILFIGGRAIIAGRISVGDFVEINARILQLTWPAISIGFVMSMYSRGKASIARVNNLLNYNPHIIDGNIMLNKLNNITVKHLNINPKTPENSLSFSLKPGQMLGVVGMSGSFKSMLLMTIYRRRSVARDCIFFNNYDINDLSLSSIYQQISVVTQDPSVFNQSIRHNLIFSNFSASQEEINEVLQITRLDRDLKQFSNGIETIVGERGVMLSGGQRQRLALARALLAKRPLLILDDALSAVDAETAQHIINGFGAYLQNTMIIVATHHLAAVKNASRIIVLDKGQVVADGDYDHLYNNSQLFRELS